MTNIPHFGRVLATFIDASVTRLGDLFHFGHLYKASGNNYFAQSAIFVKVSKSLIFLVKSFLGNFYLATFYWSHCSIPSSS